MSSPNWIAVGRRFLALALLCFTATAWAQQFTVPLSGANEVPPVKTAAKGTAQVTVGADGAVSGTIATEGVAATAAHIHAGAAGANGPVAVPFAKSGDNTWAIAAGAKLNAAQLEALKKGGLYINVHSAANPGGEIRGQITP